MARRMRKPVSQHAPARLARWQLHLHLVARLAMLLLLSRIASTQETLEGTLMFLHVWKCGGTSMRKLLCSWAERENLPCATVATCKSLSLQVFRHAVLCTRVSMHCHIRSRTFKLAVTHNESNQIPMYSNINV